MKKFFAGLGSVLLISFLISCSALSSSEGSTSLIVQLPSTSARSAETPEWAQSVSDYSVTLEQVSVAVPVEGNPAQAQDSKTQNLQPTYKKDSKVGGIIEFKDIQVGEYTVTVYCFDSDGSKVGEGSNTAIVREGEQSSVKITISQVKTEDADSTEEEAESEQKESDTKNTDEEVTGEETKEEAKNEETPSTDDANTDKTRGEPVAEEKPVSDDSQDETSPSAEVTYGGTVSLNGTEYNTLAEALVAANQTSPSSAHTITLNGNVKENFISKVVDDATGLSVVQGACFITQNVIIDLNKYTLAWDKFTATEDCTSENPLFHISSGKTLFIKNGTIASESGVEHSNILIGTTGGTVVLNDVVIKDVDATYILSILNSSSEDSAMKGSLFCDAVTIKDCKAIRLPDATTSSTYPIYINNSDFYAKETNIENVLGATATILIYASTSSLTSEGAFVGGTISLTSSESYSSDKSDKALAVLGSTANFALASSTVYSDCTNHGIPVMVGASSIFNLANGFRYKYFDSDTFGVNSQYYGTDNAPVYITAETLELELGKNVISSGDSSNKVALQIGSDANNIGSLYMGGKSEVYGIVGLALGSALIQTGEIESETTTKLYFGDKINSYANQNGNAPLYWGVSRKKDDTENYFDFQTNKFEIYDNTAYEIKATNRSVSGTSSNADGNTIYAPVLKTE
ncbi:MAG: hypothetical protein IJ158_06540 [Treponema sp.]|nr:hypothetical protein [Treponema sp.]